MSEATQVAVKGQDAQAAEGAKESAWDKWVNHVMDCKAECRNAGVDCFRAVELRRAYRRALMRINEIKLHTR